MYWHSSITHRKGDIKSLIKLTVHVDLVVILIVAILIIQWNPSIPDTLGTVLSVMIKGGILISGVVLYCNTVLYSWDHVWCPD